jgi:hypothetical protein
MKKYIIGIIIGFSLATVSAANAEEIVTSLIGKTVQGSFPIKVDGKQLTSQAAVIDGTAYLPVRDIGDALNKDVTFDANLGIELKAKAGAVVSDPNTVNQGDPQPQSTIIPETKLKGHDLNQQLSSIFFRFGELENIIKDYRDGTKPKDKAYDDAVKENEELKVKLNDISEQIKSLQQ